MDLDLLRIEYMARELARKRYNVEVDYIESFYPLLAVVLENGEIIWLEIIGNDLVDEETGEVLGQVR